MNDNSKNLLQTTKAERLTQVIDDLLNHLPAGVKLLARNYIDLSVLFEENEEKVQQFIDKTKEVLHYVENGCEANNQDF